MYLAVNLKTNTILLKHWQQIGGRRIKVSCELKAFDEEGRAAEVLRRFRGRGLVLQNASVYLVVGSNGLQQNQPQRPGRGQT